MTVGSDICQDGNGHQEQALPTAVVVLPSTTYRAADFVDAARALGVDLVVASEEPPPFDMGDRWLQIDCTDPEIAARKIIHAGDRVPIDGVIAADDAGVEIAALTGQALGLPLEPTRSGGCNPRQGQAARPARGGRGAPAPIHGARTRR